MVVVIVRRTDSGRLNHVANGESLDCLVLGGASRAVAAADGLDVAATLLVTAAVRGISFASCCFEIPVWPTWTRAS